MAADPKDVVQDYLRAIEAKNFADAERFLSPNLRNHTPPSGLSADRAGLIASLKETAEMSPDMQGTTHAVIAEGDLVAVQWSGSGTDTGPGASLPPTGRHVTMSGIDLYRVRDGHIVDVWGYDNGVAVLRAQGVL